jgi:hypothetical protein
VADQHQPEEYSTARENHVVVSLNLRTGRSRVVSGSAALREMSANVREEQKQSGVTFLARRGS